ncbi:MAG: cytochrome c5 [Myxococcota bacterium]
MRRYGPLAMQRTTPFKPLFLVAAVVFALLLSGCDDLPKETTSRCYPDESACAGFLGANASVEPDLAMGADLFRRHCTSCHGSDGRGNGFPDRGDFTDPKWHTKWSDTDLFGIIKAGRGSKMPGFRLPTRELKSLTFLLRSLDSSRGKSDARIEKKEGQGPYMGP